MKKKMLLLMIIILIIIPPAFAHSGRTDANGGHHVTATGEYHYHHGYPAHQHENGICPYADDSSGSISTSTSKDNDNLIYKLVGIVIVVFIMKSVYQGHLERRKYKLERDQYATVYSGKSLIELAQVPDNIKFDKSDLPIITDDSGLTWGDSFTVFITKSGGSYHKRRGCSSAYYEAHIFNAIKSKSACKKCVQTQIKIPEWYKEYLKIKSIKAKYKID